MTHALAKIALVIAGLVLSAGGAMAADASSDSLAPRTLGDYLRLAHEANPAVQAAHAQARAAAARAGISSGLPNPTLAYGYYVASQDKKGRQELILQQEIPFPGKRGLREEVTLREAAMVSSLASALALDIAFEVKTSFYELVGLIETARVLESEKSLLQRMRDVAGVRYSSGDAEQQEVLKVELALSRLADETTVNRRDTRAMQARLNELMGRDATAPLPEPVWVMPDTSITDATALTDSALAWRPEVAGAREQIAMANASRQLAGREFIPDFMLGVNYEFNGEEKDWWELMAGIDIPIWIGKNRAMVREAEALQESAHHTLQAERLRARRDVEEAVQRARAARERLDRFTTTILPQAEATFASSEGGYRTGRVDFIDYLDSERMLLQLRKEYAMVIADLGIQFAALERAMGTVSREP